MHSQWAAASDYGLQYIVRLHLGAVVRPQPPMRVGDSRTDCQPHSHIKNDHDAGSDEQPLKPSLAEAQDCASDAIQKWYASNFRSTV